MKSIPTYIAVFLGIALPSLIMGRSVFAVLIGVSVILILIDLPFATLRRDFKAVWQQPLGLSLTLVFALGLPSIFASDYPLRSFQALFRTYVFCCFGVLFWSYLRARPELAPVWIKSLVVSSLVYTAFAYLSQYVWPEPYWFLHLKGWISVHLNHTLKGYAAIVVFVFPLLVFAALRTDGLLRPLALAGALSFLVLNVVLENRASIAGLLALLIAVGFTASVHNRSKLQVAAVAAVIVSCFAGAMVWLRVTRDRMIGAAPEADYFLPVWLVDFERQTIWTHAFEIGMRTPWFGRGPNTVNFAPGADKYLEGTQGLNVIPAHPHNWVVEVFAEIGSIGLVVLVGFLLACAYRMLIAYRRSADPAFLAAIAIFAGYWGSGLFNFSFWAAWWQLGFILSMALALSSEPRQSRPLDQNKPKL